MDNLPYFTIILPTYNRANLISNAIESVLNQTFTGFELIIIDDGSNDNTKDVVASYQDDRIIYHYKPNEERNFARNRGIELARGSYLNFLDSDDYLLPNHLQEAYNALRSIESDILMQGFKTIKDRVSSNTTHFTDKDIKKLPRLNRFHCSGAFIRNSCFNDVKFIESKNAVVGEDRCLWLQLAARYSFKFNNAVTSVVVEHENRSLNSIDPDKLIKGKKEIIKLLKSDEKVVIYFGWRLKLFASLEWSFIANTLASHNRKKEGRKYTWMAIKEFPVSLVFKRTLAAIKNTYL